MATIIDSLDYSEASEKIASSLLETIISKKDSLVCFAGGDSPTLVASTFVEKVGTSVVDTSKMRFVSLDEWVPVPPTNKGSVRYYLNHELFGPLHTPADNITFYDVLNPDLNKECQKVEDYLNEKGPIDWVVLGVGVNGHIGFNEPGDDETLGVHTVELSETTREVGVKYFDGEVPATGGITLGIKTLKEAKNIIIMASKKLKKDAIDQVYQNKVSMDWPLTQFLDLDNVTYYFYND